MTSTPLQVRRVTAISSLVLLVACADRDLVSPLRTIDAAPANAALPIGTGALAININYNGQDASVFGTEGCPFLVVARQGANSGNIIYCNPLQPNRAFPNLAAGVYDVSLGWPIGNKVILQGPDPVTIQTATTSTKVFDVTDKIAIVTGQLTVNGQPVNMANFCLFTPLSATGAMTSATGSICKSFFAIPPATTDGRFTFFVPPGAGKGELRAQTGNQLITAFDYVVVAGATLDLSTLNVDVGDVHLAVRFNGQDVNMYSTTSCGFTAVLRLSGTFNEASPTFCGAFLLKNFVPGTYDAALRWMWSSSASPALMTTEPVVVSAGVTTHKIFDVSSTMGIVTALVTVNGSAATNVTVCLRSALEPPGPIVPITFSGNVCRTLNAFDGNRFKLFVPVGSAQGEVQGMSGNVLRRFNYTAVAGQTVDIGPIAVDKGDLRVMATFKGQQVAAYATDGCPLGVAVQGTSTASAFFCAGDALTISNLSAGAYDVALRWTGIASWPLANGPATITAGAVTTKTLEVSSTTSLVRGSVTINGQAPSSGTVCVRLPVENWDTAPNKGAICKSFAPVNGVPSDGRFAFFVPQGCGRIRVTAATLNVLGEKDYCALAGEDKDVGDPIGNRAPVITSIGGPYAGAEGSAIQFVADASDADGDALTYEWNFGDGSTGSGASVSHVYADNGSYTAMLTVRDAKDASASATAPVSVANVAPMVHMSAGATLIQGEYYESAGSFSDPGLDSWVASVSYDGGSPVALALDNRSFALSNVYNAPGSFTIVVTIADDDGGVGEGTAVVRVWSYCEAIEDAARYVLAHAGAQQTRPLLASLEAACASIERGNLRAAVNQLGAFLHKLEAFARAGKVSAADAAALVTRLQRILGALSK